MAFIIPLEERETSIGWSRLDDDATIYTTDETVMTRLEKLVAENPKEWRVKELHTVEGKLVGKTYICPVKLVSFRGKSIRLSAEEKQRRAELLRNNTKQS